MKYGVYNIKLAVALPREERAVLAAKLRSVLSISAKVQIKAPGTIERSEGKSTRVIDKRKLY
jgi:phenylacetate-coenzyme A ligase PaaK-like adenylate-forming protein